jgi:protein SCO1/2
MYSVNNPTRRTFLITLILTTAFLFSSCQRSPAPAAKRYPFTGRVVSIDSQSQSAVIDGDPIPGFMDAMAMPYKVKPDSTLNHLTPGDSISAEVVVLQPKSDDATPDYWLENVKVTAHVAPAAAANSPHLPAPGEDVPDFSFTNQGGKRISLKQYRGKVLLVTFIYTRCPFPDFCPRMSSNFAEIYRQLNTNPALANTRLLSISFDPDHDTPKVLRDYAFSVAHTHEPALFTRWDFAAPTTSDLPKIAAFFALTINPEGGLITHTLSTAVIGPDGKIVNWYHGSDWQVSDLIKDAAAAGGIGKGTTSVVP